MLGWPVASICIRRSNEVIFIDNPPSAKKIWEYLKIGRMKSNEMTSQRICLLLAGGCLWG